jgi:hypothetical protein
MLWLLGKTVETLGSVRHRKLVEVTCRIIKPIVWKRHKARSSPRKAVLLALRWARGDKDLAMDQLRAVADAAYYAADAADAAYAAYYAAYAADAAYYAAYAADAAYAAADAARAARATVLKRMAQTVRRHYPRPPRLTR